MRFSRWLCLILVLGVAVPLLAGDIQVTCEPGLPVYLDGKLMGISSVQEDGLFLMGVADGPHTIRVEKPGFPPQTFEVEVSRLPIQVEVGSFAPEPAIRREKEVSATKITEVVGDLTIISAPQVCVVEIDGQREAKTTPYLAIGALAPGKHTVAFSKTGFDRISGVVTMQPGAEITLRGDLINGKVETSHEGKGSLRVISEPNRCTVRILGMTREKMHPILNLSYLPAGEHRMVVTRRGMKLSADVLITNRHKTTVRVNFVEGAVPFTFSYQPE